MIFDLDRKYSDCISRQHVLYCAVCYSAMNHFRTVRPFRLNGWGASYNGKGRFVFVSLHKNDTITLYCHIPYVYMGGKWACHTCTHV